MIAFERGDNPFRRGGNAVIDIRHAVNNAHNANGVSWYYNDSYSWGFARENDPLSRNSCDTNNTNPEDRLCWHTHGNEVSTGWRCGATTGLNGNNNWERKIFQAP